MSTEKDYKKRIEVMDGDIHYSPFTKPSLLSRKNKNRKANKAARASRKK